MMNGATRDIPVVDIELSGNCGIVCCREDALLAQMTGVRYWRRVLIPMFIGVLVFVVMLLFTVMIYMLKMQADLAHVLEHPWEVAFILGIIASLAGQVSVYSYFKQSAISKNTSIIVEHFEGVCLMIIGPLLVIVSLLTVVEPHGSKAHVFHVFATTGYLFLLALLDALGWLFARPVNDDDLKQKAHALKYREFSRQLLFHVDGLSFIIVAVLFIVVPKLPMSHDQATLKHSTTTLEQKLHSFLIGGVGSKQADDAAGASGVGNVEVGDQHGGTQTPAPAERIQQNEQVKETGLVETRKNLKQVVFTVYKPLLCGALAFHLLLTVFLIIIHFVSWENGLLHPQVVVGDSAPEQTGQ